MSSLSHQYRGRRATAGVSRSRLVVALAVIPLLFGLAGRASAATRTWTGAGGDTNVSTPGNWQGSVAPGDGDDVVFPSGIANTIVTQDLAVKFNSMDFATIGGAIYHVSGPITIVQFIQVDSGEADLAGALTLYQIGTNPTDITLNAAASGAELVVSGQVNGQNETTLHIAGTGSGRVTLGGFGNFVGPTMLLANPQTSANTAHVTYFREGDVPITRDYALGPQSRTTIDIGADAALVNRSFGMQVTFDAPGVADRSMYFGTSPFWSGGHESAGTTTLSYDWLLAEGATGPFFETFILLANPTSTDAQVTVTFLPQGATPVVKQKTVAANSRMTINIEGEDPTLGNAAVATQIHSTQPLVAERSQYWPDPAPQWSGQQRAGTGERELRRDHHLGPGDCRGALDVLRRHRPGLGRRHQRDSLTAAVTKVAAGGSPSAPDGGFIPVAGTAIGIAALELPAAPVLFSVQECPRPTVRNAAQ